MVEAVLLFLTPVERVLEQRVCKGWRKLLREPRFWRELDLDAAEVDLANHGLASDAIAQLVTHAGSALQCLRSARDRHAFFSKPLLEEILPLCPNVRQLLFPQSLSYVEEGSYFVSMLTAAALLPALSTAQLGTVDVAAHCIEHDFLSMLALHLPGCEATILFRDVFDDEAEGGGDPTALLLQAAQALCVTQWPRVRVEFGYPQDCDLAACPIICSALRGFMEALATAPATLQLSIKLPLDADCARWVTRAVPPHLRIDWLEITCAAEEVNFLGECFRPSAVLSGSLTLAGPTWSVSALSRAQDALNACAREHAAAGRVSTFELKFEFDEVGKEPLTDGARGLLAGWLRGSDCVLRLEIGSHVDWLIPLLLPALPECLQELRITAECAPSTFELAMAALESRRLPALKELTIYVPTTSGGRNRGRRKAQRLLAALAAQPRDGLSVTYWLALDGVPLTRTLAAHLAFLAAACPLPCPIAYISDSGDGETRVDCVTALCTVFMTVLNDDVFRHICANALAAGAVPTLLSALHSAAASSSSATEHFEVGKVALLLRALLLSPIKGKEGGCLLTPQLRPPLIRALLRLLAVERAGVSIVDRYKGVSELLHCVLSLETEALADHSLPLDILAAYHVLPRLSPLSPDISPHLASWLSVLAAVRLSCRRCRGEVREALLERHAAAPATLLQLGQLLSAALMKADHASRAALTPYLHRKTSGTLDMLDTIQQLSQSFSLCPELLRLTCVRVALHSLLDDMRCGGSLLRSKPLFCAARTLLHEAERASAGALSFKTQLEAASRTSKELQRLGADAKSPALLCALHPHYMGQVGDEEKWPLMMRLEALTGDARACAGCGAAAADTVGPWGGQGEKYMWRCAAGCRAELCHGCMRTQFLQGSHRRSLLFSF